MSRLPPLNPSQLTPEQEKTYQSLTAGPRGKNIVDEKGTLTGPFNAMLYSPQIGNTLQELGAQLRFHSELPPNLLELAIITIGAHWKAQFEFWIHSKLAKEAGITEDVINAIKSFQTPNLKNEEKIIYDFCQEMLDRKRISTNNYEKALELLGEKGVLELVALLGYYSTISILLNTFDISIPSTEKAPFDEP
ncbi:MAG: carboxymuconolactone decarboxylase family protein [Dehalococcoidia bacterium]|nr:carboxymuconolactone decarboxylase family protein [Dehalococcoidia bacterium]|tara:strand:- start:676 stop:1251 length:576 start_codon:yes stop_codon:yes gene_type:complete